MAIKKYKNERQKDRSAKAIKKLHGISKSKPGKMPKGGKRFLQSPDGKFHEIPEASNTYKEGT